MVTIERVVCEREPYFVRDTASALEAAEFMASRQIGAVCVLDDNDRLCGIFSERDLLNRVVV
ncbi:MAG: CBS domain-containing protein, partial [Pyrinomonadaceae bacterium]|nr:CBS domain-containing protein [Pyrinomonadaceae bacterium]